MKLGFKAFRVNRRSSSKALSSAVASAAARRATVEALERRQLLTVTFDSTFDGDGIRVDTFSSSNDATSLIERLDGAGYYVAAAVAPANSTKDVQVTAYTAAGEIDTTFGTNGAVVFDFDTGTDRDDVPSDITINPTTGVIYVSGFSGTFDPLAADAWVAAITPAGLLDTSFSGDGKVVVDMGNDAEAFTAIEFNPSNEALALAGTAIDSGTLFPSGGIALAQLTLAGIPDSTFGGGDGWVVHNANLGFEAAMDLKLDGTRWVIAGTQAAGTLFPTPSLDFRQLAARFTSTGDFDMDFALDGRLPVDFGRSVEIATSLVVASPGNYLFGGVTANGILGAVLSPAIPELTPAAATQSDFTAFAINAGTLDTSFSTDGMAAVPLNLNNVARLGAASDIVRLSDGSVVLVGGSQVSGVDADYTIIKFNAQGILDATFGDSGISITDIGGSDGAFAAIRDAQGRIVAVGHAKDIDNNQLVLRQIITGSAPDPDPSAPAQIIELTNPTVNESAGTATFQVILDKAATEDFSVVFSQSAGPIDGAIGEAEAGTDFVADSVTPTLFLAGSTSYNVTVGIVNDSVTETTEQFTVTADSAIGVSLPAGSDASALIKITDDDTSIPAPEQGIVSATLRSLARTFIAGDSDATGKVKVRVINNGEKKSKSSTRARVFAFDGETFDIATAERLGNKSVKLKNGANKSKSIDVTVNADTLEPGVYNLFVVLSGREVAGGTQVLNLNTPITVVAPTVSLVGSTSPLSTKNTSIGKTTTNRVSLTNNGNSTAKARARFNFVVTGDGTQSTPLASIASSAKIDIGAGKTKIVKVKMKLASSLSATLAPGTYTVLIFLTTANTDPLNATDGTLVGSFQLTLAGAPAVI